jgi:hypothetical protein
MAAFKAFKPSGMEKIARSMGYTGNMNTFGDYLAQDPMRQNQMNEYTNRAIRMARGGLAMDAGGMVNQSGDGDYGGTAGTVQPSVQSVTPAVEPAPTSQPTGTVTGGGLGAALGNYGSNLANAEPAPTNVSRTFTTGQAPVPIQTIQPLADGSAPTIGDVSAQRMQQPGLPVGGVAVAQGITQTPGQIIDPTLGQVQGSVAAPITGATTSFAQAPIETDANVTQAVAAAPAVDSALNAVEAAQGTVSPEANVIAAQQAATSVGDVKAAQGNAILMDNPVQREIQEGELISGSADAQKAAQFTEQVQAAQATPSDKATIQGQLTELMDDFEGGKTPAWAAGAMRKATQAMAARGLGSSSLAGQAVIQATMEAALPIAQADASVQAQFESQNLSNRQQRAILAAQQRAEFLNIEFTQDFQARVQNSARIADIANMNFTAEQQVALENSRAANTMNLNNLSNRQGVVMAEAAALAQMDMANLSNRQQAAVMNAQNFMQTDMANLSNRQQTETIKAQQRVQSLFTDQAAENASRQFNASSQNQTDQFFANLANNVSQFNTAQANGQAQFNAGQANVMEKFNAEINNQRDQFNAQNQVVIAQSNAQWRRQLATADTAAINRANEVNAQSVLNVSNQAYANMWQMYGDTMEWAWTSAENSQDRVSAMAIAQVDAAMRERVAGEQASTAAGSAIGNLIGTLATAYMGSAKFGK